MMRVWWCTQVLKLPTGPETDLQSPSWPHGRESAQVVLEVERRMHKQPILNSKTHLQKMGKLVVDELLEFGFLQLVLVALPSGILVENINEGHHGLLQLRHPRGPQRRDAFSCFLPCVIRTVNMLPAQTSTQRRGLAQPWCISLVGLRAGHSGNSLGCHRSPIHLLEWILFPRPFSVPVCHLDKFPGPLAFLVGFG